MALPIEITPNPLITSTVEIRFVSEISEEDVLGKFFPIFSNNFPKLKEKSKIPFELKKERPEFQFSADYIMQNDKYSLSVGNNVIAFENIGTYQLWSNYYPFIKENLELLRKSGFAKKLLRIGIRYASIFENSKNIEELLNFPNIIQFNGYAQENQFIRSTFKKGDINLLLQVAKNAKLEKLDQNKIIEGLYIDIDASSDNNLPNEIGNNLYDLIDSLHNEQKKLLFEGVMKKDFLDSLKPKY